MEQRKSLNVNQLKRLNRLINAYEQHTPHITKKDLAEKIGYAYRYVIHMFSGTRPITDAAVEQFAETLGVRKEYLYGHDNFMTETELKRKLQYADAYSALIYHACDDLEYLVIDRDYDFSLLEDKLSEFDIRYIRNQLNDRWNRAIIYTGDYDDEDYKYSLIDGMAYINMITDIRSFINIKIQQTYEDNSFSTLTTLLKHMDLL